MKFPSIWRKMFKILGWFFGAIGMIAFLMLIGNFSVQTAAVFFMAVGLPLLCAIILLYLSKTSAIYIDNENIEVKLGVSTKIPFSSITKTELREIVVGKYQNIRVLALFIFYGNNKKIKIHVDQFENHKEFLKMLGEKIGDKMVKQ